MQKYMMLYILRPDDESPAEDKIVSFKAASNYEARLKMDEEKKKAGGLGSSFQLFLLIDC